MKKAIQFSRVNRMLPLRVWGTDYPYSREMALSIVTSASVSDPIWSHYPLIKSASPESESSSSVDPVVSPRDVGGYCKPLQLDGRSTPSRITQKLHSLDSIEVAHACLTEAFVDATNVCRKARYLTPAQLIRAAISRRVDDDEPNPPPIATTNGFLIVDLSEASLRLQSFMKALLYLLRDLAYRSRPAATSLPKCQIAMSGRSAAAGRPPVPYSSADPKLDLGQSVAPELRHVDLAMPMHCLAVGASGVGKTQSLVVPRLKAHLAYRLSDGTQSAALIVDPKRELATITESFLADRGESDRLFLAGRDGRVRLFPRSTTLSLHDRVTELFNALGCSPLQRGDSGPWIQKSLALLLGLIDSHAVVFNQSGRDLYIDLMNEAGRDSSAHMGYWASLRDVVRLVQEGAVSVRWLHQRLIAHATAVALLPEQRAVFRFLERYAAMDEEAANQISYVTGHLEGPLASLCDEGLCCWLDTTPVPEVVDQRSASPSHDIGDLIDGARALVFQPPDSATGDVGTRLVKAQFYRAAMQRTNLLQPVLFLCDEFQRYVTGDRESGEASLLDRCRAYRVTAVLATQSVSALYDALSTRGESGDPKQAVNCMLANIGSAFYFQTCDDVTTQSLQRSLPISVPRGWVHPLEVLPLSSLHVGEAYFVAPQGKWGRTRFGVPSCPERSAGGIAAGRT